MDAERRLQRHEANEIETFVRRGLRFFRLDPDAPPEPEEVVSRVHAHLASAAGGEAPPPSEDVIVALGALLGQQYVRALKWEWTVRTRGEDEAHVVADRERKWVVMPIQRVFAIVSGQVGPDVLPAFQNAVAGVLPPSNPGSWARVQ